MIHFLQKYNIVSIVPMRESIYKYLRLPKKIKLSRELLQINYAKYSPFVSPQIISYQNRDDLLLWFIKKKSFTQPILLPEEFLIYKALQKEQDTIFIFSTEPKRVYVIKNHKLVSAFFSYDTNETICKMLKNEYLIERCIEQSASLYEKYKNDAVKNISFLELIRFSQLHFSKEQVKNFFIQKLSYPIIAMLILYMGTVYMQTYFMQQHVEQLTKEYNALKMKNKKTKSLIKKHNRNVDDLQKLLNTEFVSRDPFSVLYSMGDIIKKGEDTTLLALQIQKNRVILKIKSKQSAIKFLKRLNALAIFNNVIIENTFKMRDNYKVYTYNFLLTDIMSFHE